MGIKEHRKFKSQIVVLNIGVHATYQARRDRILSRGGFRVLNASVQEALAVAADYEIGVAIFGHLVHPADRLKISVALRRRYPGVRLVVMYAHSVDKTESADAVIQIDVPAADLVHAVEYLVSQDGGATAIAQ